MLSTLPIVLFILLILAFLMSPELADPQVFESHFFLQLILTARGL